MITYILTLPNEDGIIVDANADILGLDLTKVKGKDHWTIEARFEDSFNAGGPTKEVVVVDFPGFGGTPSIIAAVIETLEYRAGLPDFVSEIENLPCPLLVVGESVQPGFDSAAPV